MALKEKLQKLQPDVGETLPGWQTMIVGFISGACGPLFNAPIDTLKTRIQKTPSTENGWVRFVNLSKSIIKNEGYAAFYKGLTPRILRVAPGQSITFFVQFYILTNYRFMNVFTNGSRISTTNSKRKM